MKLAESAAEKQKIESLKEKNNAGQLAYYPFYGHFKNVIVAVDVKKNAIVGSLDIDPLERRRKQASKKPPEEHTEKHS
jgi:hypothetical protein